MYIFLRIKEGRFDYAYGFGNCVKKVTPTHALLNNWDCKINKNKVICKSSQKIENEEQSISYEFKNNGEEKITLKLPEKICKTTRKWCTDGSSEQILDGTIVLHGETIKSRIASFRIKEYQDFLDYNGLDRIYQKDPNTKYSMVSDEKNHTNIFTDGKVEFIDSCANVTGAKWVLFCVYHNHVYNTFLYTLEDYKKLNLPKEEIKKKKIEELGNRGYFQFETIAQLQNALLKIEPKLKQNDNIFPILSCDSVYICENAYKEDRFIPLSNLSSIRFRTSADAKNALKTLKNSKLSQKSVFEIKDFLKKSGFKGYEMSKYSATIKTDSTFSFVNVDLKLSTTYGKSFDSTIENVWSAEV